MIIEICWNFENNKHPAVVREESKKGRLKMGRMIRTVALSLGLLVPAHLALAQTYPSRPITFLQGYAPGGNADVVARIIGKQMAASFGHPVVVESRPGAGGNLASKEVARAKPDGYTIVLLTTAHAVSPTLYPSLGFDPIKDFEFVGNVADAPFLVVVNDDSPFKDIKALAAAARAKPGGLTVGTAGIGTGQHVCEEMLGAAIGTKFVHVPFRGDASAVVGLLSHTVDVVIAPGTAVRANIKAHKFRALAISSSRRWTEFPDVPTIAETVAPSFEVVGWLGVATTHGVPKPIIARLDQELKRDLSNPEVSGHIRALGLIPRYGTPQQMKEKIIAQLGQWKKVLEKAGIKPK